MGRSKFSYNLIMKFWKLGHVTDNWPLVGNKSSEKTTSAHIVPINQVVRSGGNHALPMQVLEPLVERADCVAIMKECLCRRGQKCRSFPHDFGCLTLGPAARDIDPSLCRIVAPSEALAHAERAVRMGLVPLVVHDAIDAWMWGIDFRRMMNVCFCCDCCCDVRIGIRAHIKGFYENIHRLPGLNVSVGEGCVSCGTCRSLCLADAIEMTDRGVHITENCKGCGRCVPACPQHIIMLTLDPHMDWVTQVLKKYESRTDVGSLSEED